MNAKPLRRALVALVVVSTVSALLVGTVRPASAQSDPVRSRSEPTMLDVVTSPEVVGRILIVSSEDLRDALAEQIHSATRLVRPRQWGEKSVDVAVLQTLIDVQLVDGLYGPATATAHAEHLRTLDIDPTGIVPGESVPPGPSATAAAPQAPPPVQVPGPTPTPAPEPTPAPTPEPEPAPAPPPASGPSADQWAALRYCESSGNYSAVNPSGAYRGAYQFSQQTWNWIASDYAPHLVGVDPATASPADQDFMAQMLYQEGGAGHWPVCGRHIS